jgi:hypothetical protein
MVTSPKKFTEAPSHMPDGRTVAQAAEDYRRSEWVAGYPHASAEEIQILMDAEEKTGRPPFDLEMAKILLQMSEADQKRFWGVSRPEKADMLEPYGYPFARTVTL